MMNRKEQLQKNLAEIQTRIADAVVAAGRDEGCVRLVAVTKYVDAEITRELIEVGAKSVGESRPQVFREKHEKMTDLAIEWHLIGHLQRNKVKCVLPHAHLIHSVDSLRLIQAIEDEAEKKGCSANVLLEVNISGESAKHGFTALELDKAFDAVSKLNRVKVKGLMGMSRFGGSEDEQRREFNQLRELRDKWLGKLNSSNIELNELSMGMTGDFEIAIAAGATLVRIGSALFEGVE